MLRITLILALSMLFHSCSDTTGDSRTSTDSIYADYLENETLRKEARKAGDTAAMERSWARNTELLREEMTDSLRFALLRQRMSISRQLYATDSTIAIAHNYEAIARTKKDSNALADAWFRLAFYYRGSGNLEKGQFYDYKTIQLARDIKDTATFAKASINLANSLNRVQNYNASQKAATEALFFDPPDEQKIKLYNALAMSSGGQENYKDKIYWLDKAIALHQVTREKEPEYKTFHEIAVLSNNKAMGFFRLGEAQKALTILDTLAKDTMWVPEITIKNKRATTEYARVLYNLAKVKYHLGQEGPKALIEQSETLLSSIDNKKELAALYLQMARFYQYKEIKKARPLAMKALDYARQTYQTDTRMDALKLLTELSARPKAYALEYQQLTDSVQSALNSARDAYARYQYDVDRTREQNRQLAAQTRIQALEIRDSRIRNIFLAITIVILVGAGSLGYRLIRARARLKQAMEVQKTEAAIAKRIHDELANDLYNTMTFAELHPLNEAENKDHLLNNLEDIYKRTRNISRENAGLPTGSDFGIAVNSLIKQYRSAKTNILVRGLNEVKWEKLEDYRQQTLYRVLQELLVNMRKHSEASLVVITFTQNGKKLDIGYKDNGKGLPGDHIPGGGGIQNIESRLRQTGGRFKLESTKGKGIKVAMAYD